MPPVLLKDGVSILADTITYSRTHVDYPRVCLIATDYTIYSTGLGIEGKLKQFNMRETDEAFKQRKQLSQMITPDLVNAVRKPLEKVPRTPANISIVWKEKDIKESNEKKKELLESGMNFWGDKSYEKYIAKRLPELDTTDPNTFVIIESSGAYNPKDPLSEKLKPYPFEANSFEAINYEYINNVLQWLIVLNHQMMVDNKGNLVQGDIFYLYLTNENVKATQIHADVVEDYINANTGVTIFVSTEKEIPDFSAIKTKTEYLYQIGEDRSKAKFFIIRAYSHKMGKVPAKRVGTITDTSTRNRTCVPVIHPAQAYFEKSIKSMSEFDLTNCLHVFPRLIQYADACEGYRTKETVIGCSKGITPEGTTCKACNGSGFKGHTSAQDVLQVRMPRELSEIVSLEHILVYKSPPIDLLKFQQEFAFDKLRNSTYNAVYNDTHIQASSSVKTATEVDRNMDDVYDTLQSFGDNYSDFYVWGYGCIASIRDMGENIVIHHNFPSDFKFQSLGSLLDELAQANKSEAESHVKYAINKKILQKIYIDQPKQILKLETQSKYNPFPGMEKDEISLIITSGLTTRFNCILYSNFGNIFSKIESEANRRNIDFYEMAETMQITLIQACVNDIIRQIDIDNASSTASAFRGDTQDPIDIEAQAKANLKGSVGGVTGILDIQVQVANGETQRSAGLAMLREIFGFDESVAEEILGTPKLPKPVVPAAGAPLKVA